MILKRRLLIIQIVILILSAVGYLVRPSVGLIPEFKPLSVTFPKQVDRGEIKVNYFAIADRGARMSEENYRNPYRNMFGGWLKKVQVESKGERPYFFVCLWRVLLFLGISTILAIFYPNLFTSSVLFIGICFLSLLCSLRLSEGWDEFYVNLSHARNLFESGSFSVNQFSKIEATVDTLPFLITGILGWLFNFDLQSIALSVSMAGTILVILASWLIVSHITCSKWVAWLSAFTIAVMPNVLWIGATGFMSILFSAHIMFSVYLCYLRPRRFAGFRHLAMGSLCLIRTEGILFACLAWLGDVVFRINLLFRSSGLRIRLVKILFFRGFFWAMPFVCLTVLRYFYFGSAIPLPILFKNTGGDFNYIREGLIRLESAVSGYNIGIAFVSLGGIASYGLASKIGFKRFLIVALSFVIFTLSYFAGGGDWFPDIWSRYLSPFLCFVIVFFISGTFLFATKVDFRDAPRPLLFFFRQRSGGGLVLKNMLLLLLISLLYWALGVFASTSDNFYATTRKQLNSTRDGWQRIQMLSYMGAYLRDTLPPGETVGSPEVATMPYFARKDLVCFLGVASPLVALSGLNPMTPGDRLHRKRSVDTIAIYQPAIFAAWGMEKRHDSARIPAYESAYNILKSEHLAQYHNDVMFYRMGSFKNLQKLGYEAFLLDVGDHTFYYWVHPRVLDYHVSALERVGFRRSGVMSAVYETSADIVTRFKGESDLIQRSKYLK